MEENITTEVYKVLVRGSMGDLFSYWTAGELQLRYSTEYRTLPFPGTDGLFAFATLEHAIEFVKRPTTAANEIWRGEATGVRPPPFTYITRYFHKDAILRFWQDTHKITSLSAEAMGIPDGTVLCDSIRLLDRIY